jgi:magnesium chelatase accessory protein
MSTPARPDWDCEGADWPNRDASRFVDAGGCRWHVQVAGQGPVLLLVHGTGAATHSWRHLLPCLVPRWTVVAPDLPGQGFSSPLPGPQMSLPGIATALGALLVALGLAPAAAVGHSAGAAVLARMSLDRRIHLRSLVALNGALLPLGGLPALLFGPAAFLFRNSRMLPDLFVRRAAQPGAIRRLLDSTGSTIEPAGEELYARLVRSPGHVASALAMMAHWDLRPLARDLPQLVPPLLLVVGDHDRTMPPAESRRVHALVPGSRIVYVGGAGHLVHEERAAEVAALIDDAGAPAGGGPP